MAKRKTGRADAPRKFGNAQNVRRRMGLDTSKEAVAAAEADPNARTDIIETWGVAVTPSEQQIIARKIALWERGSNLVGALIEEVGKDAYGGALFEWSAALGAWQIGLVGVLPETVVALRPPLVEIGQVEYFPAEYSAAYLARVEAAVKADTDDREGRPISDHDRPVVSGAPLPYLAGAKVDVLASRVMIFVWCHVTAQVVAQCLKRYGPAVVTAKVPERTVRGGH